MDYPTIDAQNNRNQHHPANHSQAMLSTLVSSGYNVNVLVARLSRLLDEIVDTTLFCISPRAPLSSWKFVTTDDGPKTYTSIVETRHPPIVTSLLREIKNNGLYLDGNSEDIASRIVWLVKGSLDQS